MIKIKLYTLLVVILFATTTFAQSGILDTSFGNNGIVLTDISPNANQGNAVSAQVDGKIVVAGYAGDAATYNMAVARYNTDGSLDTSFGDNGTLNFPVGSAKSIATGMEIQADGKIILGGYTDDNVSGDFALVRLNTDGTFDNTFGNNGIVIIDAGGNEVAKAMTILDNGKILLAGANDQNFSVARFNTDGTLDTTFGVNGWSIIIFEDNLSLVKDLTIQEDGKILLGGDGIIDTYGIAAARINADGTIDNTFGTNGKVRYSLSGIGNSTRFGGIAVQGDGKIFLGGWRGITTFYDEFLVLKLNTDGTLDSTYGYNGVVTAQIVLGYQMATTILLQSDGKLILAGYAEYQSEYFNIVMVRFNTDGNLDTTFGTDGKVSTDINGNSDFATAISLQTDNKILLTGFSGTSAQDETIFVARYENTILGTEDFQNMEFRLYPNPANEQITIELSDASSNYLVEIFDVLGKKVYTSEIQKSKSIDVSALAPGTYLVKINSENNTSIARFVKQ
ncbi:T9SS type A sorting domain-containing protein [Aequorivita antarctica]|nr:T9SS type A sorting domain-containing protein [Aequorivita antarctica]SRX72677.1 hypothetical protein AEQU3_00448 [Aequorivita antarctica]